MSPYTSGRCRPKRICFLNRSRVSATLNTKPPLQLSVSKPVPVTISPDAMSISSRLGEMRQSVIFCPASAVKSWRWMAPKPWS